MDLPDRGVLSHQLTLPAAQFGDVPHQHQGTGPGPAHDERNRTQLDHRAVSVTSASRRPARGHHHQRLVKRLVGGAQPGRDHAEFGSYQVGGQAEAAVGRLGVRAGVGDPPRLAQPEQPVADPRRPDQHRVGAGERERPLRHHPGQVVGALHVGQLEPARSAGRVQVGAPLDDGDHPVRPASPECPRCAPARRSSSPGRSPARSAARLWPRRAAAGPPARRTSPTTSSWSDVGPVVGRIWAIASQPVPSLAGAHRIRSAKDRSASSCQSDTSECSHSTSASPRLVWLLARSFSVGTASSSHPGRRSFPPASRSRPARAAARPARARTTCELTFTLY